MLPNSAAIATIASQADNLLPSNIPLRTLPSRSREATPFLEAGQTGVGHRSGRSLELGDSSDSSWTDTGDIGEQLADEDDPVRIQLPEDLEEELLAGVARRQPKLKRVRVRAPLEGEYPQPGSHARLISKETIDIPEAVPRCSPWFERLIASITMGRLGSIHGLTGRPLMLDLHSRY